ncbi:MAG: murein biosynthesis integral membrane protein MurJ [Firmicutes bacterium HGW-Firmicutes-15]|nr:MAG: murein biosynthesis integral membrane protein MurJ [Firmicutes bacterium HGW-Firmicutes-15]
MNNKTQKTGKTFIGVSIVIFMSKLLGFGRDIVFASIFGTTILTDLFQLIFSFPGYLFASVGTALSSVNIPDLTYYINNKTREERNLYLSNLFAQITLWATLLCLAGIVFAPAITRLIAPGLSDDVVGLAVLLTRIMIPTLLFVSLTYVAAGVLQVHSYFLVSSSISIPFNLLVIGSLLMKGEDIIFLGYVTTLGWFLQFLIQVPVLFKEKYQFFFRLDFKNEHTVLMFKQLMPILLGNSILQLCMIIDRSFATHLEEGTTAALGFGSNLFVTITSIFIVAMSTVIFPRLSQYCLDGDNVRIRSLLNNIFKILLFILLPYLVLVLVYNQEIVALVYERGAFTSQSTDMTALAFLGYSFAVVGYACQEIFNRVYYALKKFKVPMLVSMLCIGLKLLLDFWLFRTSGIIGISASTAVCLLLYAIIMALLLRREIGNFLNRSSFYFMFQLGLPVAGMVAVILGSRFLPLGGKLSFLLPLMASGCVYLLIAYFSNIIQSIFVKEADKIE